MSIGSILGQVAKSPFLPAVAGGIAGALGGTQGGRTATHMPTTTPGYQTFGDLLRNRIQDRLMTGTDLGGYEATGLQNINEAYGGAQQALDASLTSRGLGTSPVAGAAEGKLQQARGGEMSRFLNTIPLLQREIENQDLSRAQGLYQSAGLGQSSTQPGGVATGAAGGIGRALGEMWRLNNTGMMDLLGGGAGGAGAAAAGAGASLLGGSIAPTAASLALEGSAALPAALSPAFFGATGPLAGGGVAGAAGAAAGGGGAAAGGLTGALGLGGGPGLFGLGAATIPVIGGIVAGGILASKLIGRGRKAADVLTRDGGMQKEFENVLAQIDADPSLPPAQKKTAKFLEYQALVRMGLEHARQGSQQQKVVRQMFNTISPLFGQPNPLG